MYYVLYVFLPSYLFSFCYVLICLLTILLDAVRIFYTFLLVLLLLRVNLFFSLLLDMFSFTAVLRKILYLPFLLKHQSDFYTNCIFQISLLCNRNYDNLLKIPGPRRILSQTQTTIEFSILFLVVAGELFVFCFW